MIRLLTHNIGWKIASLALAVLLWMAVVGEPEMTTSISAPLEFRSIPKDLEISSEVPERLHLEVSGPSGKLGIMRLADSRVIVDLARVNSAGEKTFSITSDNVALPSGVTLSRALPSQVRLQFERRVTRDAPVRVRWVNLPAGYRVVRTEKNPDYLSIVGPERSVRNVANVETDAIDLSGIVSEGSFTAHAFVSDSHVRLAGPDVVQVKVFVEKAPAGEPQS